MEEQSVITEESKKKQAYAVGFVEFSSNPAFEAKRLAGCNE